jgi:hypothetical protein
MEKISLKIQNDIDLTWEKEGEVVLIAYSMIKKTEETIKYVLTKAFQDKNEDLIIPVFSCIKELANNSIKANIKSIMIKEKLISDPEDKFQLISALKKALKEDIFYEYGLKTKEYDLSTRIYIRKEKDEIIIRVINPVPLDYHQLQRISTKMETSQKYNSLADIYLENPDPEAEGMGLGISMITILLKSSGIHPDKFRIYSDMKEKTIAEIAVPLT